MLKSFLGCLGSGSRFHFALLGLGSSSWAEMVAASSPNNFVPSGVHSFGTTDTRVSYPPMPANPSIQNGRAASDRAMQRPCVRPAADFERYTAQAC